MKAGTTSLYHYLRGHPEIFMSKIKELDFFVYEINWERGFDWYRRQFSGAGPDMVAVGEASTNYAKYPRYSGVPSRIAESLPGVRLIYVIRHPIERMRSHYRHSVALGVERDPIHKALLENPVYRNYSQYGLQIEQYLQHFPREQLLIITSEELRHARTSTMQRVYAFIGVDKSVIPSSLEREYYKTDERRTYSPLIGSARRTIKKRLPASKRAKELVDSLGNRQRTLLGRQWRGSLGLSVGGKADAATADLSEDLTSRLNQYLKEDVELLRSYMPSDFDGWGIG